MKKRDAIIYRVLPDSIAEESGIEKQDILKSINGEKIEDVFDYRFLIADENLVLEVLKKSGQIWEIEIEKEQYEDLGLEFNTTMMDDLKSCENRCIFCFIDQLPKGMRETLYFKDDDSRLSFLTGNYVTLTNMKDTDIDKIIKYKMSPINISVHATCPELRIKMLRNKLAGNIIERIKKLVDNGIIVNCQIVLCREVNDGCQLDRTVQELASLYPGINSVSIVPVGITKYRENLFKLKPYDIESSKKVIDQIKKWQDMFLEKYSSRIIFLADEFYKMAGVSMPKHEEYEDFPQIENGVGLVSSMDHEIKEYIKNSVDEIRENEPLRHISIATGVSAYEYIKEWVEELENKVKNLKVDIYKIENFFFGENITVAGLITGQDLIEQLEGKISSKQLLISSCMLKSGENIFLDNYTVEMVEEKLNVNIISVNNDGEEFVKKILGIEVETNG